MKQRSAKLACNSGSIQRRAKEQPDPTAKREPESVGKRNGDKSSRACPTLVVYQVTVHLHTVNRVVKNDAQQEINWDATCSD